MNRVFEMKEMWTTATQQMSNRIMDAENDLKNNTKNKK